jgi:hypothetical protein
MAPQNCSAKSSLYVHGKKSGFLEVYAKRETEAELPDLADERLL